MIKFMELAKKRWSESLKIIKPAVKSIYYKGEIDLLLNDSPKLAIVGSRRMTEYGGLVIEKWLPVLVEAGVTIVSGFMYGVDQTAHRACLDNGGKTIAVLGWGIEWTVGAQDVELYQRIIDSDSLIISEYEGKTAPQLWLFPQRNRLVAGVADAVLVVEGSTKSGSLITAKIARQMGKELLAVPGQVTSRLAEGTNGLIREGVAVAVTSAEDVLAEMGLSLGQTRLPLGQAGGPVWELLADGERSVDEISRLLTMEVPQVLEKLTELLLGGVVSEAGGKYRLK